MVFNNTVLYCKGWYKRSNEIWKDLARCIAVDYMTTLSTKEDVVAWLLYLMDENFDIYKANDRRFGIGYVMKNIVMSICEDKLSYNDAIIKLFIRETSGIYRSDCSKVYKPNDKVLPFNYRPSRVDGFAYTTINGVKYNGRWLPADMREDILKRIDEMFDDGEEQENIPPINIL